MKLFIYKGFGGACSETLYPQGFQGTCPEVLYPRGFLGISPTGENWRNAGAEAQAHLQKEVA